MPQASTCSGPDQPTAGLVVIWISRAAGIPATSLQMMLPIMRWRVEARTDTVEIGSNLRLLKLRR